MAATLLDNIIRLSAAGDKTGDVLPSVGTARSGAPVNIMMIVIRNGDTTNDGHVTFSNDASDANSEWIISIGAAQSATEDLTKELIGPFYFPNGLRFDALTGGSADLDVRLILANLFRG